MKISIDTKSREEMIDDMALPFLDMAEKIEAARVNKVDKEAWRAILETNLFLWRFMSNFLPKHFSAESGKETKELLRRISDFMVKVSVAVEGDPSQNPDLIRKVIQLNLNMCDQILSNVDDVEMEALNISHIGHSPMENFQRAHMA